MKTLLLLLSLVAAFYLHRRKTATGCLTFDDEFNGAELDLSRWVPHDPEARHQLQSYAPEAMSSRCSGGQVAYRPRRRHRQHLRHFSQTYGRFEIRCRVPAGRGLRPRISAAAASLWAPLTRIEVFETHRQLRLLKVSFANRWGTEQTERSFGDSFTGPDLSTGFHTLSIEWDRDRIAWFIDGKEKFQSVDGIPRQPMYLLIDLAVGGPDVHALPASFDIDYIRVYHHQ